ncbi:hypothetical protein G7Y89_g2578 [Cudoniella acicularis]|uniref:Apple domain-containing protein n=1 Tax=Cudoniella acicularis TaxID=354080 RepID=A0A8H4RT24_9HELO|nr:hypothetical protein G7Y89_g2578 [Cudoniella acicularis]
MQSFATIIAASALFAGVSASPLKVRSTCGSAPAGSGSEAPISQPTGITTAAACQAQCEANTSCQSFVFGMVNNADECMLYSVPAASVPKQSSTNLIAYDKACTSVPSVVPTASNPTGLNKKLAVRDTCGSAPTGSGSQTPLSQSTGITTAAACQAQCEANSGCLSFVFGMVNNADECMLYSVAAASVPTQTSTNLVAYDKACTSVPSVVPTASNPTGANTGSSSSTTGSTGSSTGSNTGSTGNQGGNPARLAARDTCGSAPVGPSGNASPISTPANIDSAAACQAQCQADSSCESFEYGTLSQGASPTCRLFSVAAASVPAPTSGQSLVVYDVGCSV